MSWIRNESFFKQGDPLNSCEFVGLTEKQLATAKCRRNSPKSNLKTVLEKVGFRAPMSWSKDKMIATFLKRWMVALGALVDWPRRASALGLWPCGLLGLLGVAGLYPNGSGADGFTSGLVDVWIHFPQSSSSSTSWWYVCVCVCESSVSDACS